MIDHIYVGDLGAVVLPPELVCAAGWRPERKVHWRVKRRLDQLGAWLLESWHG